MKKSLILWMLMTVLAVFSLPAALILADSGKEKILISEEILSGDPAEAEGIVLRIPSHWGRQLLWDTEYTIGEGKTESSFTFSSGQVSWKGPEVKTLAGHLQMQNIIGASFGPGTTSLSWEYGGAYAIINSVVQRTENGETHTEIIRLGDYSPNYPLDFSVDRGSIEYEGDHMQAMDYLRDFFHIGAEEDKTRVTVKKNTRGEITEVGFRHLDSDEDVEIFNAAADGGRGIYFVYGLRNAETGEFVDRGQNSGIFYFPYEEQKNGFRKVDVTQVRKLQDFPGKTIPLEMLTDDEGMFLFLAAEDEEGCSLFAYRLEGEMPVLTRRIPVKEGHSSFCRMSPEAGGIMLTWDDNSFSFVTEENGEYRLWCSGTFPKSSPFSGEHVCIFDGERLTLAAYENRYGLNVLLAVYDEHGQTYSGRYVHSGNEDTDAGYDYETRGRTVPRVSGRGSR